MRILATLLAAGCALGMHQAIAAPDFTITPAATLAAVYDDNIFISPQLQQSDEITRLTPAITFDFKAENLSLGANYSRDADYYSDHSQLDSSAARQSILLTADYRFSPRFSIDLNGAYLTTPTAADLNTGTGFALGRIAARRKSAGTALNYSFTPTQSGSLTYDVTSDSATNGNGGITRAVGANYSKVLSDTTTLLFGETYRSYQFDRAADQHSNTPTIGFSHQFSSATSLRVQAGPRIYADSVKPDVALSLQHEFVSSKLVFDYTRSETVLAGVADKVESELTDAVYTQRFGKDWQFSLTPAYGTLTGAGNSTKIYRMDFDASYRLSQLLSLAASWQYSHQQETLGAGAQLVIPHNLFVLGINVAYPIKPE